MRPVDALTRPEAMGFTAAHGPPLWLQEARAWQVSRYADMAELMRRTDVQVLDIHAGIGRIGDGGGRDYAGLCDLLGGILFFRNPPFHDQGRRFLIKSFGVLKPAFERAAVESIAAVVAAEAVRAGQVEACAGIAIRLPLLVMRDALGLSEATSEAIVRSGLKVIQACQRALSLRALDTIEAEARIIAGLIRRDLDTAADHDGGLAVMAELNRAEFGFGEREMVGLVFMFVMAGTETTSALIASALMLLAADPEEAAAASADPDRIAKVLEETLRLAPPVRILNRRIAPEGFSLGGQDIAPGAHLHPVIELANRDPDAFPEPHGFRPGRGGPPPFSFGGGRHVCIGAALGKLEAQSLLEALLPAARIALLDAAPEWLPHPEERRLARLHLRLSPLS